MAVTVLVVCLVGVSIVFNDIKQHSANLILNQCTASTKKEARRWLIGGGYLLPASCLLHFPQLSFLFVDVSGQVAMTGDALHLRVVLELLFQLLVVVYGGLFSGCELRKGKRW